MRLTLRLTAIVLLSVLPMGVQAQTPPQSLDQRFATANVTRDGCLTLPQARAGRLGGVVKEFPLIDSAHRGCVTLRQIKQFRHQKHAPQ
jgi:hypothetical protein